jgi:3-oxoacyl-[acyl-carrier protein] reductase
MDLKMTGKTALITGSSAGIAYAAAAALTREGASVILNGRDPDRLADAHRRLLTELPTADVRSVAADVATAEGTDALIAAAPDVDILINSAATFEPRPFGEIPDAEWARYFETNVMSGVRLSRHHLDRMLKRNDGRIVFVNSDAAIQVTPAMLHYSVTKTALLALARGLAEMTRGTAVTVNTIVPGPTATEGVENVMRTVAEQTGMTRQQIIDHLFKTDRASSLIQRLASPREIADLIAYLASPLSSVVNGAVVRAEGGVLQTIL